MKESPKEVLQDLLIRTDSEDFESMMEFRNSKFIDSIKIKRSEYEDRKSDFSKYENIGETKTHFKIGRQKPFHKQFEDRVWKLIYSMGASLMSRPNSTVLLDEGKTKEIDVIGKVENNVFIVECKSSEDHGSRSLRKDLSETNQYKRNIAKICHSLWGDNINVIFVYALENIKLSGSDLSDAENFKISVWSDNLISYFEDIIKLLGKSGRYQIFAEIFGDEEILNYSPRIPAIKGKSGSTEFYYFLVRPSDLLKISYIHHRKLKSKGIYENPYQRMVNKKRIEDIRDFIKKGGHFSNNVIINFKRSPDMIIKGSSEGIEFGILTLPNFYKSAWVIDGQHRLFGYTETIESENELIPVFAYESLPEDEQGKLFININKNQKPVDPNLLWDLYGDIYYGSKDEEKRILCTISTIGKELNSDKESPFYGHIFIPSMNDKSPEANVSLYAICIRLLKGSFIKRKNGNGDLFLNNHEETIDFANKRMAMFFNLIKKSNEQDWNLGESGFTRSNIGVHVLMIVFQEILKEFRKNDKNPILSDVMYESELTRITKPMMKHLSGVDKKTIDDYKRGSSEKAFSEAAKKICSIINGEIPSFFPEILKNDDVESENPQSVDNPNQILDEIERKIRDLIHSTLMNKFGPTYWENPKIIFPDIKQRVEDKIKNELIKYPYKSKDDFVGGERKVQFCDIMDYDKIIISGDNWLNFQKTFKSKENLEKRFKDLTDFRNVIKHSRDMDELVKKDGEAAIMWFSKILGIKDMDIPIDS